MLGGGANHLVNAVIGGWQWSGIERWTSGLPFSFSEPGWSTDWQIESFGVQTGPVKNAQALRLLWESAVLCQSRCHQCRRFLRRLQRRQCSPTLPG